MLRDTLSNAPELSVLQEYETRNHTYQTTNGISAAMASSIPAAASGGLAEVSAQLYLQISQNIVRYKDS